MLNTIKKNVMTLMFSVAVSGIVMDIYISNIVFVLPIMLLFQVALFCFCERVHKTNTVQMKIIYVAASFVIILVGIVMAYISGMELWEYVLWIFDLSDSGNIFTVISFFVVVNFFMGSLIYYCSNVSRNMLLNFLLVIMPVLLYQTINMYLPRTYSITLCILFFLVAWHCNQRKTEEGNCYVAQGEYKWTVILFVGLLIVPVLFLPQGIQTPYSVKIQRLESPVGRADSGIDDVHRNSANVYGNDNLDVNKEEILFYVDSHKPLYLKTESYQEYNFEKNRWEYGLSLSQMSPGFDAYELDIPEIEYLYKDIAQELEADPELMDKYHITQEHLQTLRDFKGNSREISITPNKRKVNLIPYPVEAISVINNPNLSRYKTQSNDLGALRVEPAITKTIDITYEEYSDDVMEGIYKTFENTDVNQSVKDLEESERIYSWSYEPQYLFYYENADWVQENGLPKSVKELAQEITEDCKNEVEKLEALEAFFHKGDFTYDDQYRPKVQGIEYFLFESKRGACAEYATAMTLMAQALNLRVRYTEGYQVVEYSEKEKQFIVRNKHGHAYVEAYIDKIGWRVFEPTVSLSDLERSNGEGIWKTIGAWLIDIKFTAILQFAAMSLLCFGILQLLKPRLKELGFRIRVRRAQEGEMVGMVYRRIWYFLIQKHKASVMLTSNDFYSILKKQYGYDSHMLAQEHDKIAYGTQKNSSYNKDEIYNEYKNIYKKIH